LTPSRRTSARHSLYVIRFPVIWRQAP
jgi:hypothetical protein